MKEQINKILNQALSGEHQAVRDYSDWATQAESLSEPKTAKLFKEIGHDEEHHVSELTQEIREMVDRAEDMAIQDVIIGAAMGEGGIPIHGRENRKEPCKCCKTDDKLMCSSSDVIGLLSQKEIKEWCSEIILVPDGRCERAKKIKEAARECKEKYPHTAEFWECYAPAFSKITRGSNPGIPEVSIPEALRPYAQEIQSALDKMPTSLRKQIVGIEYTISKKIPAGAAITGTGADEKVLYLNPSLLSPGMTLEYAIMHEAGHLASSSRRGVPWGHTDIWKEVQGWELKHGKGRAIHETFWDPIIPGKVYDIFSPEEDFASAFATFKTSPETLKSKSPAAFQFMEEHFPEEAIPKAEAGMTEEQRKELLERGIVS